MLQDPTVRPSRLNRAPLSKTQRDEAVEAVWRSYWPHVRATILGVIMLVFGLALAGLEAAKLDANINVDTIPVSMAASYTRAKALQIGVGIWSGAIVAVAAVFIFVISKSRIIIFQSHLLLFTIKR